MLASSSSESSLSSKAQVKAQVINRLKRHQSDTGSPEVQIGLLSKRIEDLSGHLSTHPKDIHTKRGMLRVVGQRKRLLEYLKGEDIERYRAIIATLNIRK